MSGQRKCTSCGGVYLPVQADGSAYYHACGPASVDAFGKMTERADKRDENIALDADGRKTGIKAAGKGAAAV